MKVWDSSSIGANQEFTQQSIDPFSVHMDPSEPESRCLQRANPISIWAVPLHVKAHLKSLHLSP